MGKWNFKSKSFAAFIIVVSATALAVIVRDSFDPQRAYFGLSPDYNETQGLEKVQVAVIDTSFIGYKDNKDSLPDSTTEVQFYSPEFIKKHHLEDPDGINWPYLGDDHGRHMAQIIWGLTGYNPHGPKFYLLNARGPTNLRRAFAYAAEPEHKADIILLSQAYECCGLFDGGGWINDIVNEATKAGIIVVVAAGDYGHLVYNGPVHLDSNHNQVFDKKDGVDGLRFRSHSNENEISIIMSWNAAVADETVGTDKDLDLMVYDEENHLVAKSALNQIFRKQGKLLDAETYMARESVTFKVHKTQENEYYHIRVAAKGGQFSGDGSDTLRIAIHAGPDPDPADQTRHLNVPSVDFVDATPGREIMVPADNPNVITVGEPSTLASIGPTMDAIPRWKPDILLPIDQTSNAAAYFAGILAVMKAEVGDYQTVAADGSIQPAPHILTKDHLKHYIDKLADAEALARKDQPAHGITADERSVGMSWFSANYNPIYTAVQQLKGEQPMAVFQNPSRRLIVAVPHITTEMGKLFPKSVWDTLQKNPAFYELYLVTDSGKKVWGTIRPRYLSNGARSPYPWEANRANPFSYVELRLTGDRASDNKTPMWKTPTPSALHYLVH